MVSIDRRCLPRIGWILLWCGAIGTGRAQELEPRAYSPNPAGVNFLVLGYTRSTGGVLIDASLPLDNVVADLDSWIAGYGRSFGLFGRSASVALSVPYAQADVSGDVAEMNSATTRSGLADPRLKLGINLLGGEMLSPRDFARRTPRTTLGASLTVVAPLGQYDASRLINLGANRWAFKPELGISHPVGHWYLEAYAGVWLFTDNDDYFGGTRLEQEPVASVQAHVSYTFRPRLWIAADATYYQGGQTTLDGIAAANLQENTRVGLTLSIPVAQRQSVKLSWSEGASTRFGEDFTTYGLVWQYMWFD